MYQNSQHEKTIYHSDFPKDLSLKNFTRTNTVIYRHAYIIHTTKYYTNIIFDDNVHEFVEAFRLYFSKLLYCQKQVLNMYKSTLKVMYLEYMELSKVYFEFFFFLFKYTGINFSSFLWPVFECKICGTFQILRRHYFFCIFQCLGSQLAKIFIHETILTQPHPLLKSCLNTPLSCPYVNILIEYVIVQLNKVQFLLLQL